MSTLQNDTILVIDDTAANVKALTDMLASEAYLVLVARDGESALERARQALPLLILLDAALPGSDGFTICRRLKADAATAEIPVIFMTAPANPDDKLKGFAAGGADCIVRPLELQEVLARVRTHVAMRRLQLALAQPNGAVEHKVSERTAQLKATLQQVERLKDRLQQENRYLQREIREHANHREIVGASTALCQVMRQVELAATQNTALLIHGESGTGKELAVRAIHERSPRRERALIKLDCSAVAAGLIENELFGSASTFTGSADLRIGSLELADGSTLFLDQVSELPLETQARLLRVLQTGDLGSTGRKVDVRLIAASTRDLRADVVSGRFRADLYQQLSEFTLRVPALRERAEDIPALAQYFLERCARKLGKPLRALSSETLAAFRECSWPGNIRELRQVVERAAILADGEIVRIGTAPNAVAPSHAASGMPGTDAAFSGNGATPIYRLVELERQHFITVLKKTRGVIEGPHGAARLLDLKPSTARFRIKKLGIRREDFDARLAARDPLVQR